MRDASIDNADADLSLDLRDGEDGWELLTYDWQRGEGMFVYGCGGERVKVVRKQPLRNSHGVFTIKRPTRRAAAA